MSWIGVLGVLLCLAAVPWASVRLTPQRLGLFMLLLVVHVVCSVVYYFYALTTSADSALYYYDYTGIAEMPTDFGTVFVIQFTQWIKTATGGTYLDLFLIFQVFGFWGVVLLMRTFEEVYSELGLTQPPSAYLLLFIPGIQFWTSAIGKDGALFFGVSLAVWAAMQLRFRFLAFGLAVLVMLAVRPHIAFLAVLALAGAIIFEKRATIQVKIFLIAVTAIGGYLVASTVQASFGVNLGSADSVAEFFEEQSEVTAFIEGGSAVTSAPYPIRLMSLLFRPMFIDAQGMFGYIASAENIVMLIVIGMLIYGFRESYTLARNVFFLRFSLIFAIGLIVLLSIVYYNVGLGLRQRIMFMPALLTFFVAFLGVRRARLQPAIPALAG
jgi:hypothetical protein